MNLIGSDMILFGYYLIFLGSKFQVHKPLVLLVAVLINGVKKQVPQVSFEIVAGDLMSILFYEFDDIIFYGYFLGGNNIRLYE